jgi:bacteriocin-like protein
MKKFALKKIDLKTQERKAFEKLSVKMLSQIRGGYD